MKVLAVFLLTVAFAVAEFCHHDDDCHLTVCSPGLTPECYDHNNANVCTCVVDGDATLPGYTCTTAGQCENHWGRCHGDEHEWHCIDSVCRCAKFGD